MTIYVPPNSLISAVLFSGSLTSNKMVMVRLSPSPLSRTSATSTSRVSHCAIRMLHTTRRGFSQHGAHCYITNFRPRPRPLSYCPWYTYTKRCHERDQARIKYVGTVRVREIMRPPTNQSIRRHLSDCSLTLGCPVPPSLPVAHTICLLHYSPRRPRLRSPTGSGPMPDAHARVIAYSTRISERGRRMWTDRHRTWGICKWGLLWEESSEMQNANL